MDDHELRPRRGTSEDAEVRVSCGLLAKAYLKQWAFRESLATLSFLAIIPWVVHIFFVRPACCRDLTLIHRIPRQAWRIYKISAYSSHQKLRWILPSLTVVLSCTQFGLHLDARVEPRKAGADRSRAGVSMSNLYLWTHFHSAGGLVRCR